MIKQVLLAIHQEGISSVFKFRWPDVSPLDKLLVTGLIFMRLNTFSSREAPNFSNLQPDKLPDMGCSPQLLGF